ncbi:hypothetical protein KIN20_016812 [Parelaphostrongylus tenuis]|uniref:fumarate reductase (NADH) n=1 Tax=Parelaphostrongylus tenuis TaxID=148309 RepID=A0AAD5MMA0_PARTN|nr:hypothetical protein KIN20_016812 [Parelaphostrongylus tenuis]
MSKTRLQESNLPVARPLDAPRGRIANIRRESDCSLNNEVEHERMVKTSQQVSCGFDDITLEKSVELRRRAPSASSIGEPISIVTNVFLPHSCSPSPTRVTDMHKQCYSPSTNQMVRPNIPYSASPSPTQSPTRQRLLRSLSPITTKTTLKRRYATSIDEVESKRSCGAVVATGAFVRSSTSPLVTDRTFPYPSTIPQQFAQPSSVNVNCTPSSSSAGIRRLTNSDSIIERHDSGSTADEQKGSAGDVEDVMDVQMNESPPSEVSNPQPSIVTECQHKSSSCESSTCSDECKCVSGKSSVEEEEEQQQSEQAWLMLIGLLCCVESWKILNIFRVGCMLVLLLNIVCALTMADSRRKAPSPDEPVIIVGGGLAGLAAAIEALGHHAKVIIIDSEKNLGGNSAKASSGINACGTSTQEKMGINDSRDLFYMDTMNAGDRENDEALVDILVDQSSAAIEFLMDLGVDLSDINLCGGHSVPRTHWIPSPKEGRPTPVGMGIINAAKKRITEIETSRPDDVTIMTDTRVVGLTSWNAYVNGVNVIQDGKRKEINGKAVILTTGGFSADRNEDASLLHEFASDKLRFPTTNGAFARGDGVKMARAMGAQVIGMDRVQIHPTAFVDPSDPSAGTKFLAAEALRGKGAILINSNGVRFANELGRRDYLTERILRECKPIKTFQGGSAGLPAAFMMMNDKAADSFGRPAFNFYANIKKLFTKYNSSNEFAELSGISFETLKNTLLEYNKHVKVGSDATKEKDSFGKTVFPVAIDPSEPIYIAIITPAIHYTMGGLKIDKQARVYNEFISKPFNGLLAAGEVTGGVHGANRLAGNSLLECVVFGRIAGRTAAGINYTHEEL